MLFDYKSGDILQVIPMYSSYVDKDLKYILYEESYKEFAFKYFEPILFQMEHLQFFKYLDNELLFLEINNDELIDNPKLKNVFRIKLDRTPENLVYIDLFSSDNKFKYLYIDNLTGVEKEGEFIYLHQLFRIFKFYLKKKITFDFNSFVLFNK